MLGDEPLPEARRRILNLLELLLVDLAVEDVHRRFGLLARDAVLQPRHDRQPAALAVLQVVPRRRHLRFHRDRHHHVRVLADHDAVEAGRRDADDRHRQPVERHGPVQHARIGAEAPRPIMMAEHRDRMAARRTVVVRREGSADVRADAEHVEIVAGDELAADALGLAVGHHRERRGEPREHAVEHGAAIAEVAIHRVREGAVVERASLKRAGAVEDDQPLRRFHRQEAEQHLVGERKDGRVGADPERERHDDDERERRRREERPRRVAEVLQHGTSIPRTRRPCQRRPS